MQRVFSCLTLVFVLFCLEANGIDIEVTHRDVTVEEMGVEKTLKEKNVE